MRNVTDGSDYFIISEKSIFEYCEELCIFNDILAVTLL